ncbi:hypothetical protein CMQ_3623 [Grosmannia clavigera kw1407]|uniref:Uncharacterized protein n=1 Tax=Grosmannia clavigera (strain kw1407 / UAMH 11150) TaxID=655863 RepID=F0X9W9_GROCL|nr:uncharacterized protein CMQ_3623 [Grosmannia clavigera kw1407]EFX05554.1 hypothetical protein CMQ_3623 [Grosmannia clavigera kw1407]
MPDIAAITANQTVPKYSYNGLKRYHPGNSSLVGRSSYCDKSCPTSATLTWGETDSGGKGIFITNAASDWRGFYIYQNCCDDVPLPSDFEGRVQRGVDSTMLDGSSQILGTWFEFSWDSSGNAWGDVSLIRGCDGAVLIWDKDNGDSWMGFTQWILTGAPTGAYDMMNDGQWVLAASEKLGDSSDVNTVVRDWYIDKVGTDRVYVDDWHGNGAVMKSPTGRIATYWPDGRA